MRQLYFFKGYAALLVLLFAAVSGVDNDDSLRRPGGVYSVSQKHSLKVREDGLVDVRFSIVFHVAPGRLLSGSGKTILSDFGTQGISGPVAVADETGRILPVETSSNREGWLKVKFDFAEPVNGTVKPDFRVDIDYSITNGVCRSSASCSRMELPWAHRWLVRVVETTYEITFEAPHEGMDDVCLGSLGFRSRCGGNLFNISGSSASYKVPGALHKVFFDWAGAATDARPCTESVTAAPLAQHSPHEVDSSTAAPPEPLKGQTHTGALTLGIVAIGASLLVSGAVCVCAHVAPVGGLSEAALRNKQAAEDNARFGEMMAPYEYKGKLDKLELDLEDNVSEPSTTASAQMSHSSTSQSRRSSSLQFTPVHSQSGQPPLLNWSMQDANVAKVGSQKDTGAGVGSFWDVPEEFREKEIDDLTPLQHRPIQVSEHARADVMGKPQQQRHLAEIDSIQISIADGAGVSVDPFAVDTECDDFAVQDDWVHKSASYRCSAPTMAIQAGSSSSSHICLKNNFQMHAPSEAIDEVNAEELPPPAWLSTLPQSWQVEATLAQNFKVPDEYEQEENSLLQALPMVNPSAQMPPLAPTATPLMLKGNTSQETDFHTTFALEMQPARQALPTVLDWEPSSPQGDATAFALEMPPVQQALPTVLDWQPSRPQDENPWALSPANPVSWLDDLPPTWVDQVPPAPTEVQPLPLDAQELPPAPVGNVKTLDWTPVCDTPEDFPEQPLSSMSASSTTYQEERKRQLDLAYKALAPRL